MEKIYFEIIQQTRLLDDEVAEWVKTFMSFWHFFNHQIEGSKSNLSSKKNGGIYMGTVYYLTKIVNIYIVYDLDAWPRNPINNFKLRITYLEQLM